MIMSDSEIKFVKLTKYDTKFSILMNLNDIIFVNDKGLYREVCVKLHDKPITFMVDDEIDTIYDMIGSKHVHQQPIYD